MSDHEETAKPLLPCKCGYEPDAFDTIVPAIASSEHQRWCQANRRPAIAAALAQAEAEGAKGSWNKCPRCDSPNAHLHPAVQYEGEVQPCSHPFHLPAEIAQLKAEVERLEGMLTEEYKACRIKAEQELSQELADEVSQLKAENLRLSHEGLLVEKQAAEAERDYFCTKLAEAERERDAAEAKGVRMGLERAEDALKSVPSIDGDDGDMMDKCAGLVAIRAELVKAGGKSPA